MSTIVSSRLNPNRDLAAPVTLRSTLLVCGLLLLTLLAAVVVTSLLGSESLPARPALCALFSLGNSACGLTPEQSTILLEIRFPRILLAGAVGASLAAAGASYQALLRNPLAEPYLLGISNGAAVGTMIALVFRPGVAFYAARKHFKRWLDGFRGNGTLHRVSVAIRDHFGVAVDGNCGGDVAGATKQHHLSDFASGAGFSSSSNEHSRSPGAN